MLQSCGKSLQSRLRYVVDAHVFDEITEFSAYWAGMLMADGCVRLTSPMLSYGASIVDAHHVEKFCAFMKTNRPIWTRTIENKFRFVHVTIDNYVLIERLIQLGVVPRKSNGARAHPTLASNVHFWRGVIDGDGHLGRYNFRSDGTYRPRIGLCGSESLLVQFVQYVHSTIGQTRAQISRAGSIKQYLLSCRPALRLIEVLYSGANIYLDRKYMLAMQLLREQGRHG